jgi:hypothetical protein
MNIFKYTSSNYDNLCLPNCEVSCIPSKVVEIADMTKATVLNILYMI